MTAKLKNEAITGIEPMVSQSRSAPLRNRTAERVSERSLGQVLHRRWRFETRCTDGGCQTYFLRTS
jgi:hypothetical protein